VARGRSKWFQYTATAKHVPGLPLYRRQNYRSSLALLHELTARIPVSGTQDPGRQRGRVRSLRLYVPGPRCTGALYPSETSATERQGRAQRSDRRRRVLGTLHRSELRCSPRRARAWSTGTPRALLDGAARSHADGEIGRDGVATPRHDTQSEQRPVT